MAMMIEDMEMEEYPYEGVFYETRVVDEDVTLIEQEEERVDVLRTVCDIQQASILGNAGFKVTSYNVFFPLSRDAEAEWPEDVDELADRETAGWGVPVRRGMMFRGDARGYVVDGVVEGVGWSEIGGCVAQIKDKTE